MATQEQVLVVENDPDIRAAVAETLALEGYRVSQAANGSEGLKRARSEHPDVILLDLMMPVMDGWGFRAQQEADPSISGIPVVVVTACPPQDPRLRALRPTALLLKPFNLDDLVDVVRRCAHR